MTAETTEGTPETARPPRDLDILKSHDRRGRGGRRVSKRSLWVGGSVLAIALLAVAWGMGSKRADVDSGSPALLKAAAVSRGAEAPVQPGDGILPGKPVDPAATEVGDGSAPADMPADPNYVPALAQSDPGNATPTDPELEARLRLRQRVEDSRFAAQEAALGAEVQVESFANREAARAASIPDAAAAPALPGSAGMESGSEPNDQDRKRAFLAQGASGSSYLGHSRMPALARLEVKAGTVIPGVMLSGINSDLPGQITAQVREHVYDTVTGQHLLIPAGARLIGSYDSSVAVGQNRLLVAWRRIIFPDGSSLTLDPMPGTDASGTAGMRDKVNSHTGKVYGNALLLSLFSAGVQLSQPRERNSFGSYSAREVAAAELGRQLGQLGMEMARRNLSIQPTLEIRPGARFLVMVNKDIILPEWKG